MCVTGVNGSRFNDSAPDKWIMYTCEYCKGLSGPFHTWAGSLHSKTDDFCPNQFAYFPWMVVCVHTVLMMWSGQKPTARVAPNPDQVIGQMRCSSSQGGLFQSPRSLLVLHSRCAARWAVAAAFMEVFPVIPLWGPAFSLPVVSIWQIIYCKRYSCLQGMNKLRHSLDANFCEKISMLKYYSCLIKNIEFSPRVFWLNCKAEAKAHILAGLSLHSDITAS